MDREHFDSLHSLSVNRLALNLGMEQIKFTDVVYRSEH